MSTATAHAITDIYDEPVTVTAQRDLAQGGWKVRLCIGSGTGWKSAWLTPGAAEELGGHLFCRAAEAVRKDREDHAADTTGVLRRVRDGLLALPADSTEGSDAA